MAARAEDRRARRGRRCDRGLRLPGADAAGKRDGDAGDVARRRQRQHLPRRAVRPRHGHGAPVGQRGAEAALAPRDGDAGQDRRVRAHRAEPRVGLRRARDHRAPRRRHARPQRGQALDRQREHRRRRRGVGARHRRRPGQGRRRREGSGRRLPRRLHRRGDHRQDRQAGGVAARRDPARRAGAARQPARRGALVPRRHPRAHRHPWWRGLGVARPRGRQLRDRTGVRQDA